MEPALVSFAVFEVLALLALALCFGVANGMNDGGTLLSAGLRLPAVRTLLAGVMGVVAVVLAPVVLGPHVARTFASGLVDFGHGAGRGALIAAIVGCLAVVAVMTWLSLPTSLTLAFIGGVAGAGFGAGLPVNWQATGLVLIFAALAPVAGAMFAWLLIGLLRPLRASSSVNSTIRVMHLAGFSALCVAYGANDGQKILGALMVAFDVEATGTRLWGLAIGAGVLFGVGVPLGIRRFGRTLGERVVSPRPMGAVTAQIACATILLATGLFGLPVSMTQTMAGALVGSTMAESGSRVRWQVTGHLGLAWALTLPMAFAVAAVTSWLLASPPTH